MKTKALVCDEKQQFSMDEVTLSDPGPDDLVVCAVHSGVSIGTEFLLIRRKIGWGNKFPICTGYMAVGVIEEAGRNVKDFKRGERIYYRANKPMKRGSETVYCVSGTHSALAVVNAADRDHGPALLPPGVDEEAASLFVTPAVGLNGTDMANPRMGDVVVVYGVGLIGLGVVAACAHRGCFVIAVDLNEKRLGVASALGADRVLNPGKCNVEAEVKKIAPNGADVVFEASGVPALIDKAIPLAKEFGKFVWQGNYGQDPISMHFLPAHGRRLTMFFPCDDGLAPCRRAVIKNMASGALPWSKTITHRIPWTQAPAMYDSINKNGARDAIGIVIHWGAK